MRATTTLQLPDGTLRELAPGDIIGRLPSAALFLDDERISEAHALVSLRGTELKILALRGRLLVDGKPAHEAVLEEGLVVEPAPGLELTVASVTLPDAVLAIEADGMPRQVPPGTGSIVLGQRPTLLPRHVGDAAAWVWAVGDGWRVRIGNGAPRELRVGDSFDVHGVTFRAVQIPLARAGRDNTRGAPATPAPLTIVARYDVVHVWAEGGGEAHFDGVLARILSELASIGAPVAWEVVAAQTWPKEPERSALRARWDVCLSRVRRRLRQAGLRDDLVRAAGIGLIELHLRPGDRVQDES